MASLSQRRAIHVRVWSTICLSPGRHSPIGPRVLAFKPDPDGLRRSPAFQRRAYSERTAMRLPQSWRPRGVAAITLSKDLPPIGEYVKSSASHAEDAADRLVVKVKNDDPDGRDELHRLFS